MTPALVAIAALWLASSLAALYGLTWFQERPPWYTPLAALLLGPGMLVTGLALVALLTVLGALDDDRPG